MCVINFEYSFGLVINLFNLLIAISSIFLIQENPDK